MGTHPIFESDFDCLTDTNNGKLFKVIMHFKNVEKSPTIEQTDVFSHFARANWTIVDFEIQQTKKV